MVTRVVVLSIFSYFCVEMSPIYLIGFMGSGKTTLGRALAAATGLRFIDLDEYIEEQSGATVREIFATRGEAAFREIERATLLEVSRMDDVIVACGGGTPCFGSNMELMNTTGLTVLLEASFPRLLERLTEGRAKRPLIAAMERDELEAYIRTTLNARMPHYSKARGRFGSDELETAEMIAASVARFTDRFLK